MLEKSRKFSVVDINWLTKETKKMVYSRGGTQMTGSIKRKPVGKRFGFVRGENGLEYFFHCDDCPNKDFDALQEGDKVKFENMDQTPKGPRANWVEKI